MALRNMLDKTAIIYRTESGGSDKFNTPLLTKTVCIAKNVPCALSRRTLALTQDGAKPTLAEAYRLYLPPYTDVKSGDMAEIAGCGRYRLGVPYRPRNHHIEVDVEAEGEA